MPLLKPEFVPQSERSYMENEFGVVSESDRLFRHATAVVQRMLGRSYNVHVEPRASRLTLTVKNFAGTIRRVEFYREDVADERASVTAGIEALCREFSRAEAQLADMTTGIIREYMTAAGTRYTDPLRLLTKPIPVVPPPPPPPVEIVTHTVVTVKIGDNEWPAEEFFAVRPEERAELVGTDADPARFDSLALWVEKIAGDYTVKTARVVPDWSLEQLLRLGSGGSICCCGDSHCRIGPFLST